MDGLIPQLDRAVVDRLVPRTVEGIRIARVTRGTDSGNDCIHV